MVNFTIEDLERKIKKANNFSGKDLETFKKGKEFLDKAIDNNNEISNETKNAIVCYAVYKIIKNNGTK